MRLRVCMAFALGLACAAGAEAAENVHNLTVSETKRFAHGTFNVVATPQPATLNTRPVNVSFIPGTGEVVEYRRHPGGIFWIKTFDGADRHTARCPPIPANTSSHVVCKGQFAPPGVGVGPPAPGPTWRSELTEAGVHVIVINAYNRLADEAPGADGVSYNQTVSLSGDALEREYPANGGDRVVKLKCGTGGNIIMISRLPRYLRNLDPPVANGSVVTYGTLGHGRRWDITRNPVIGQQTVRVMLCARSAADALDLVGRVADFAAETNPPEHPMNAPAYAGRVRPFLRAHAIVNLWHCYTGEPYTSPATGRGVQSVAGQVNAALPGDVTVIGIIGDCTFPFFNFDDINPDGVWQPGERITGYVPHPWDPGNPWDVNP